MEIINNMNKLKRSAEERQESIAHLTLQAIHLLHQNKCEINLFARYLEDFGLCFIVYDSWDNRRLINASAFFDLAEANILTIENIKRYSI